MSVATPTLATDSRGQSSISILIGNLSISFQVASETSAEEAGHLERGRRERGRESEGEEGEGEGEGEGGGGGGGGELMVLE